MMTQLARYLFPLSLFCVLALWPVLSFSVALMQVFCWSALIAASLYASFTRQEFKLPDRITLILISIFLVCVLISTTVTDHPKQSFRGLLKLLRQLGTFFVVFHLFHFLTVRERFRQVAFFSFVLLVLDGAFQYLTGKDFLRGFVAEHSSAGYRLSASFDNYGKLASYLCAVLPLGMGLAWSAMRDLHQRKRAWIWTLLSVLGLLMLFLTRSRGGFVAFFGGMVIVLVLRRSWKLLGILLLAGAVFVALLPRSMVLHLDGYQQEQSIVERFELWHRAWDVIREKPWTGTGINTYAVAHQEFDTRNNWRVRNYYAHNGYLQMAAEIGLPGTVAFVLFLLRWIWIHRPQLEDLSPDSEIRWGLIAGILAFMVFCLGDTALHSPQPVMVFFYTVGLLGAWSGTPKQIGV